MIVVDHSNDDVTGSTKPKDGASGEQKQAKASEINQVILPVGAVEAHGPHLPISTDPIIAAAMAEEGARRLAASEIEALLLPGLEYTSAGFAQDFGLEDRKGKGLPRSGGEAQHEGRRHDHVAVKNRSPSHPHTAA